MITLHFEVPAGEILSANQRLHWSVRARRTAWLRELAGRKRLRGIPWAPFDRAHLTVRVGWPTKHRRDVANLSPTIKALIDGCVDAGLLPDDDDEHLVGPDLRPYYAGKKGVVVLDFDFEELP